MIHTIYITLKLRVLLSKLIKENLNITNKKKRIGVVSPRNKLNDLTGSEWIYFLSSVFVTKYSTKGNDGFSHKLRKIHPSPKPPVLMQEIIRFFTKKNQWVLDPFLGVGGSLFGASLANRKGVGIELNKTYLQTYKKVCKKENVQVQPTISGDSRNIDKLLQKLRAKQTIPKQFDLIITDPPYSNMMIKKRTISLKNGKESTPFTNSKKDIGNLEPEQFLDELKSIIEKSLAHLKPKKYLVVFAKDMQPKEDHHNMLHADIVSKLSEIEKLRFRGYRIWFDKTQNLYPLGYPHAFVANQFHQFILIFRKES